MKDFNSLDTPKFWPSSLFSINVWHHILLVLCPVIGYKCANDQNFVVSLYTYTAVLRKKPRWPRLWMPNLKFKSWTESRITIIQTERCCCACYGALKDFYCMSGNITDKNTLWQLWTVKQGQEKGFSKACSKLRILIPCLDGYT